MAPHLVQIFVLEFSSVPLNPFLPFLGESIASCRPGAQDMPTLSRTWAYQTARRMQGRTLATLIYFSSGSATTNKVLIKVQCQ